MEMVLEMSIDELIEFIKTEENDFIVLLQLETEGDANAKESV